MSAHPPPLFRILSFNANHTAFNTATILQTHLSTDVIFIQEPSYSIIKYTPSATSPLGDPYYATQADRNWLLLEVRNTKEARVAAYVNRKWTRARPQIRFDLIDHPHMICVSLRFGGQDKLFLNVYNHPESRAALNALCDLPARPFTGIVGDFNLHNHAWDTARPSQHDGDVLLDVMMTYGVGLLNEPDTPTHFPHNHTLRPSVIDLAWVNTTLLDSPYCTLTIDETGRVGSDHAVLTVEIPLRPTPIQTHVITKGSGEELKFFDRLAHRLELLYIYPLDSAEDIHNEIDTLLTHMDTAFNELAHIPNLTDRSRKWWNDDCSAARTSLEATHDLEDRHNFRGAIRRAKAAKFNAEIDAAVAKGRPHDLTAWYKARRPTDTTAINNMAGDPMLTPESLLAGCSQRFFQAQHRPINPSILDRVPIAQDRDWPPISEREVREQLATRPGDSAPGLDHIPWRAIKHIARTSDDAIKGLAKLYTAFHSHATWPRGFRPNACIIFGKPNKKDHSTIKNYRPIVLIRVLAKLAEAIYACRIQFACAKFSLLHPSQCGGVRAHSTEDAGLLMVNHIREARRRGFVTTSLAIDIEQFFPSVNHDILLGTLRRMGFGEQLCSFFRSYLQGRRIRFRFSDHTSDEVDDPVGVSQGSVLSPILSAITIVPALIKITDSMPRPSADTWVSLLFYVDDGNVLASSHSFDSNHDTMRQLSPVIFDAFQDIGCVLEPNKLEHAGYPLSRRSANNPYATVPSNPNPIPLPSLTITMGPTTITLPNLPVLRYLGFFFDTWLDFRHHVRYYSNKALSTVRALPVLGNSARGLPPNKKHLLYITCVRPVMTYGHMLWHDPRHPKKYLINFLSKAQTAAGRWITGAFRTSPAGGLNVAASLIPIDLYLRTLHARSILRSRTLPHTHIIRLAATPHRGRQPLSLHTYAAYVRAPRANADNHLQEVLAVQSGPIEDFVPTHDECTPGARLLDQYADRIIFDTDAPPKHDKTEFATWRAAFETKLTQIQDDLTQAYAFADGSVLPHHQSRSAAAFRAYRGRVCIKRNSIATGQGVSHDAESVGLCMAFGALVTMTGATDLHVFVDNKAALFTILDTRIHSSQAISVLTCQRLRTWLASHDGTVTLHWVPGHVGLKLNELVDLAAKRAATEFPQPPTKSYAFLRQGARQRAMAEWRERVKDPSLIGHQFFERHKPFAIADRTKTKHTVMNLAGGSKSTCARLTRALVAHAPTGEYRSRFFPQEPTSCPCDPVLNPFQTRHHILYHCPRYERPAFFEDLIRQAKDPIDLLYEFIDANPLAFSFAHAPTDI